MTFHTNTGPGKLLYILLQALFSNNHSYANDLPRYGVDTSNVIESLNGTWSEIRNLQLLKLDDEIYTTVMKTFYDRFHRPMKDPTLPDAVLKLFQERYQWSRRYKVTQSGNGIYQVEVPDTGIKHVVNLEQRRCGCTNFQ
jgi:hypothetical protein